MKRNPKIVSLSPPMQAAAGLVPNRATIEDIEATLLRAPNFLGRLGLHSEDGRTLDLQQIGQGHYAHAFALPNGMVLKVTDDEEDARVCKMIMELANGATGLPFIEAVYRLPGIVYENETDAAFERPLFAIVMEPVVPASKLGLSRTRNGETRARLLGEAVLYPSQEDDLASDEARDFVKKIRRGIHWLAQHGVSVVDLHHGNVGYASGKRPIIIDFGHGSLRAAFEMRPIEMAMNPAKKPTERQVPMAPNGHVSMPNVRAAFDECFDALLEQFPNFGDLELHHDEKAGGDNGHGSERQFGYCMDGKPIRIAFAAKTEDLPVANIRGLMAHEFGHALDYRYGRKLGGMLGVRLPDGVERRADAIAKAVFGRTIKYDQDLIQCVDCRGTAPRPRRLG
jgi:hypothetical protein